MAAAASLKHRWQAGLDTWQRLRRWARWLCGLLVVATVAAAASAWVHRHAAPLPAPPVSVKLAGPPTTAISPLSPAQLTASLAEALNNRQPLAPAPIDALTVATPDGLLPRKGPDGKGPLEIYAAPIPALPPGVLAATKQLAIVVLEVGLNDRMTQAALALPAAVTLAYDANGADLATQIGDARAVGHEIALDIPLQPRGYPQNDPGPETLLTSTPGRQLLRQLHGFMARGPGAVAVLSRSGDAFAADTAALWPVLQELRLRGLGWIDPGLADTDQSLAVAAKLVLPASRATAMLDTGQDEASLRTAFEGVLGQLDTAKAGDRQRLVTVHAYPALLATLGQLLQTLPARGVALVPASHLLKADPAP